jgi:hypothetical protein
LSPEKQEQDTVPGHATSCPGLLLLWGFCGPRENIDDATEVLLFLQNLFKLIILFIQ